MAGVIAGTDATFPRMDKSSSQGRSQRASAGENPYAQNEAGVLHAGIRMAHGTARFVGRRHAWATSPLARCGRSPRSQRNSATIQSRSSFDESAELCLQACDLRDMGSPICREPLMNGQQPLKIVFVGNYSSAKAAGDWKGIFVERQARSLRDLGVIVEPFDIGTA